MAYKVPDDQAPAFLLDLICSPLPMSAVLQSCWQSFHPLNGASPLHHPILDLSQTLSPNYLQGWLLFHVTKCHLIRHAFPDHLAKVAPTPGTCYPITFFYFLGSTYHHLIAFLFVVCLTLRI